MGAVNSPTPPALHGISHGTSSVAGQRAVRGLIRAVADLDPSVDTRLGHVDVQQPDVAAGFAAAAAGVPVVVVPLLLSAGYHVKVDLHRALAAESASRPVRLAAALGPAAELVEVLAQRLAEAGLGAGDTIVLAAAGSSDPTAVEDCRRVGEQLSRHLGRAVTVGFLSAAEPRLPAAVEGARAARPHARVVVSSYLLAPGYFQDLATASGADVITAPLLRPDDTPAPLVRLVQRRYRAAAAALALSAAHSPAELEVV